MSNFASGYIKYINHLEQINDAAMFNPEKMIGEVESSYKEHLENIARNIVGLGDSVKICMLAGPSSSGKTTTAKLLKDYLTSLGKNAHMVSLDDYYLSRDLTPLLSDGTKDFETVDAVDIKSIQKCLDDIIKDKDIYVPKFDFKLGIRKDNAKKIETQKGDIVIVEGIHALNPVFTDNIPKENVIKLYVSVKQPIKDANGDVTSPMDLRLIRRIVRDMQFRGTEPETTLAMWNNVIKGENKYIRPYRLSADYTVNSVHIYEPCVMRTLAISILRKIKEDSPYYKKARELDSKLMRFEPVPCSYVPKNSMLREFIGHDL